MSRWRAALALLVLVVAVVALAASGEENKATKTNGGASNSGASNGGSKTETFKVGDSVKLGDWTVKVIAVADPQAPASEYLKPKAGTRWVGVDTEVTNGSKKAQSVSSLACFELRDTSGRSYTETLTDITPKAPDGEVDPGGMLRGTLVYEVPDGTTGLSLRFKCDPLSSGSATIALS